ncbi:MAG TPA: DUF3857 domain-containing protein [Flavilitoribacter sp.]|nr:DUF3857 domain-containing protein [Flavilitoribacter sp.]HMQ91427.1 DUF3857 domain-containing protein [Flavilitoribacter sp.]
MKSIKFLLLLSAISVAAGLWAQDPFRYSVTNIPDTLLKNAVEVVREESTYFTVESLKSGRLTYRKVVTLLNDKSRSNVQVINYDKESKVKSFKARIYNALGLEVRQVEKSEILDLSAVSDFSIYEDDRIKAMQVSYNTYPYTIEIEYEQDLKGIRFCMYPNWQIQGYGESVQNSTFAIDLPAGQELHFETLNIDLKPEVRTEKGRDVYQWKVANLPAVKSEPRDPPAWKVLPMVNTAPGEFQTGDYKGSMATWKDYGAYMYKLFEGRDKLPKEAAEAIRNQVAGLTTNKEKIDFLYRQLQQNMRYVSVQLGIGGWQPFDAEYVYNKKYGDCKALSNYMKATLKEIGIEAYPTLIYSGTPAYEVHEDFTLPRFNHVVLYIPSEDYWLECTSAFSPPNYLGEDNADRNVMLITPDGGKLIRTPKLAPEDNQENHRIQVRLAADGSAHVEVNGFYKGADQELIRSLHHYASGKEREEYLMRQSSLPSFTLEKLDVTSRDDAPEGTMNYIANIERYAAKAGKRLFVPLNAVSPNTETPGDVKDRKQPVVFSRGYSEHDEIGIEIPEGYQVESLPQTDISLKAGFGEYRLTIEQKDNKLICDRKLIIYPAQIPADQYGGYRDFFKSVVKADSMKAVLVEKKT